jgi:hypothetical protein
MFYTLNLFPELTSERAYDGLAMAIEVYGWDGPERVGVMSSEYDR